MCALVTKREVQAHTRTQVMNEWVRDYELMMMMMCVCVFVRAFMFQKYISHMCQFQIIVFQHFYDQFETPLFYEIVQNTAIKYVCELCVCCVCCFA